MSEPSQTPLAKFLWGEEQLNRRQEILTVLSENPIFSRSFNVHALSRRDLWAFRLQQATELIDLKFKRNWSRQHFLDALRILGDVLFATVNYRIFMKNLEAQMNPEQRAYWIPKADNFEICGSYAQTELGHGSNVQGIETTATYDPNTDEFILNSPTVSSSKFWIGALGVWATHSLVVARMILKGKDMGNHLFIVQVRDLKTHDLTNDVIIHEQGEKTTGAFTSMDNGTMRFSNKRIPRTQLLSGFVSVDRNGNYIKSESTNKKHSYTSMIIIRGLMSEEIGQDVSKAIVIALKYTQFRRQFNPKGGKETRVIEYASVQHRLFPAMCRAIAMLMLGREIRARVERIHSENVEDLHLQTVGAKIWTTEHAARDAEVARLACGGHGNMASTGLGAVYAQLSPSRTYEGETYVLSIQIGRAVAKHWNQNTENTIEALSYINPVRNTQLFSKPFGIRSAQDWFNTDIQQSILERRGAVFAKRHIESCAKGLDTSYDVFDLAMAHADLTYWRGLQKQIPQAPKEQLDAFTSLAHVFSLTAIVEGLAAFAGQDFVTASDISYLHEAHRAAIGSFANHVDTFVDALGFTEFELNSTFCSSTQSPYEALWDVAAQSKLNDHTFLKPTILHARNLWRNYGSPKL